MKSVAFHNLGCKVNGYCSDMTRTFFVGQPTDEMKNVYKLVLNNQKFALEQYKDGARVRNLDGAVLTRTSLVLSMSGYLSHLKGLVELDKDGNLKIVVLETLIVRREQEDGSRTLSSTQTELLVENGQIIEPRTPVTKTRVQSLKSLFSASASSPIVGI